MHGTYVAFVVAVGKVTYHHSLYKGYLIRAFKECNNIHIISFHVILRFLIGDEGCHLEGIPNDSDSCLRKSSGWNSILNGHWFCRNMKEGNNEYRKYCLTWRADLGRCCPLSCGDKGTKGKSHGTPMGLGLRYSSARCAEDISKSIKECKEITTEVEYTQCSKLGIQSY